MTYEQQFINICVYHYLTIDIPYIKKDLIIPDIANYR